MYYHGCDFSYPGGRLHYLMTVKNCPNRQGAQQQFIWHVVLIL